MSEPIHIISLGAGVQSSTMALMAAHGEITPMPKCAIFADTQDEPDSVYRWLEYLTDLLPFPVLQVSAGRLSEKAIHVYESAKNKRLTLESIPAFVPNGILPRQCTRNFKIEPIRRKCREMFGRKKIHVWKGISIDEPHRIKPSRLKCEHNRYPLIESRMNRWDCLKWMERNHYDKPPRSACVFCPYHSDTEWRRLKTEEPAMFESAVQFEVRFQEACSKTANLKNKPFLHRSCVPLDQVDFSTDEDHGQQMMFGNECEGMCGV